jgi:hypothetical protein
MPNLSEEKGKTPSIIQVPKKAFSSCAETILKVISVQAARLR